MKLEKYPHIHFELLKATEFAAINSFSEIGMGDKHSADEAAVVAMRSYFEKCNIKGKIVIGEGERDEAPMLYIGEKVGNGTGPEIDIAVDPLEGTTILAEGKNNALSVAAFANKGCLLEAPDLYMDKIAIGFDFEEQIISLDNTNKENIKNVASALSKDIDEVTVTILKRPRHEELIASVREIGCRVFLIDDGDVSAVIGTTQNFGTDIYIGIGGAPEGVLAAAALKTLGGQICCSLIVKSEEEKNRAAKLGVKDFSKRYYLNDMAKDDVIFCATGVTDGNLLNGILYDGSMIQTNSLILRSAQKNITYINNSFDVRYHDL